MLAVFGRIDPHLRRSITFDNDTAFAQHRLLRTMRDMTTWFCDAYASWQKGGVENANGRTAARIETADATRGCASSMDGWLAC
jgi:IS30 family transposase